MIPALLSFSRFFVLLRNNQIDQGDILMITGLTTMRCFPIPQIHIWPRLNSSGAFCFHIAIFVIALGIDDGSSLFLFL